MDDKDVLEKNESRVLSDKKTANSPSSDAITGLVEMAEKRLTSDKFNSSSVINGIDINAIKTNNFFNSTLIMDSFFKKDNLGLLNYMPQYLEGLSSIQFQAKSVLSGIEKMGLEFSSVSGITRNVLSGMSTAAINETRSLTTKKIQIEDKIQTLQKEILSLNTDKKAQDEKINLLQLELDSYRTSNQYQNLLTRVGRIAQEEIIKNEKLRNQFSNNNTSTSAVVSIDIRNSTELMLLAKTPEKFSIFITSLIYALERIVKDNFGIFDKFTGDGLLAFYPDFFCGKDSLFFALQTAKLCQEAFNIEYEKNFDCFDTIKADVGLGIGIDYGSLCFATISDDLTVVGKPVVYACRFGAAPAGHTYVNQGAMSKISELYKPHYTFEKVFLNFKNQGLVQGYEVSMNYDAIKPVFPEWFNSNKGVE